MHYPWIISNYPQTHLKRQNYVRLQTCCCGATVAGCSDALLTPTSPSAASPCLVPRSQTAHLVRSQSRSSGVDGERRYENGGREALRLYKACWCNSAAAPEQTPSRWKGRLTISKNSPRVRLQITVWWLQGTTLTYEVFCDPGELLSPGLSAPTRSCSDSLLSPYLFLFNDAAHREHATDFEAVGQRGLAGTSVRTHKQIYTRRTHPYLKGELEPLLLTMNERQTPQRVELMFQNLQLQKDVLFLCL